MFPAPFEGPTYTIAPCTRMHTDEYDGRDDSATGPGVPPQRGQMVMGKAQAQLSKAATGVSGNPGRTAAGAGGGLPRMGQEENLQRHLTRQVGANPRSPSLCPVPSRV